VIVLAVDTATLQAGVALWQDGRALAERRQSVTTHSEALLAMIDEAFAEAGVRPTALDAIVCGGGPGSFTGLRIGLATAKGLCFALDKPLVLVSSLAALAARAPSGRVCATLDAFKGEVYAGRYAIVDGTPILDGAEAVLAPASLQAELAHAPVDWIVGSGAIKYPELAAATRLLDEEAGPRPLDVARLGAARYSRGESDDLARASPTYIRPSEAELVKLGRAR
jgi:tRNA threonylcarbamoyladenosine biosynthesis protein TsaB